MFEHTPEIEVYKSLNSSDEELESLLKHSHYQSIQHHTKSEEDAIVSFLYLLIESTGLSYDICDSIISYLPSPHSRFLFFNPFNHDGLYSMLDFSLLLFNNTVHYIICIALLFHTYSSTWLSFTCFSFLETMIITFIYWYFYGYIKCNNLWISNINDEFIIFYGILHLLLIFIIDIPMIMILLYFYAELYMAELIIFSISYCICMIYKYVIYHQRINYKDYIQIGSHCHYGKFNKHLNIFPFFLLTALIIFLYGVLITNTLICVTTGIIYYFGIFIINYIHWKNGKLNEENTLMKNRLCVITYWVLCAHNILFMIFAVDIYQNKKEKGNIWIDQYWGIISIIFGIFEAFIIFIYYIFFNIIFCIFHDNERNIGEYEYTLYDGGKYKKFSDFFNYLYLTLECIINIPLIVILLFYMYNNDVIHNDIYISWYFILIFYCLHDLYSFGLNFYYTPKRTDLQLFYYRIFIFFVKLPFILLVFGIVYLSISYVNNIGPSFNQVVSFVFLIYASLYFCCILPVCAIKTRSISY